MANEKKESLGKGIVKTFTNGLIFENPTFVLMLGMCPTLAVTSSAINGMGMGLTTMVVLTLSNIIISLLRNIIPAKVRIPAYIVIIASFVTIVGQFLEAYLPSLNASLGMFIPLIVVNCIILGRAESFASKNNFILSAFDGIGMGLGFTCALTIIGLVRELLGAHKMFGFSLTEIATNIGANGLADWFSKQTPIAIFVMAPGAFFVLAALCAILNNIKNKKDAAGIPNKLLSGCSSEHDCSSCSQRGGCHSAFYDTKAKNQPISKMGEEAKNND